METIHYVPKGVCSREIIIDHEDGIIKDIKVIGGCTGNLRGICALLKGMKVDEVIAKFDGILCPGGRNTTSCPDQIAQALKQI